MSDDICVLITLSDGDCLFHCALKLKSRFFPDDFLEYPMEYRSALSNLLPNHVSGSGNIVDIQHIYEVVDMSK